jgi:four helix bundle protein
MDRLDQARQLRDRTKKFAVRVIKAFTRLAKNEATRTIGRQLLRSGTSLAANYRAACPARSGADFTSKITIVTEETDETLFWFELLVESKLISVKLVEPLIAECAELLKIFSASLDTARANREIINSLNL